MQISNSYLPNIDETHIAPNSDDALWAERCSHWNSIAIEKPNRRNARKWIRTPLILSGHGVRLSIDRGSLLIRNGFTHYPQQQEQWRYFPGDREMPSRIVILDGKGGLSFQVLSWLSTQNVPLVQINWQGDVVSVIGSTGRSVDVDVVDAQRASRTNGRGLRFARQLVLEKIINAAETLRSSLPECPEVQGAIGKLDKDVTLMKKNPPDSISKLRGVEGRVGAAYFKAWQSLPLHWKETKKRPIPDNWRRIGWRRSYLSKSNRNAHHPVNAMLNYAYGILENKVRMHLVGAGFEISFGVLHASYEDQQPMVFDMMEPLRPIVDRTVLGLVREHMFLPGDFTLMDSGVCRLNPQLAKAVVQGVKCESEIEGLVKDAVSGLCI